MKLLWSLVAWSFVGTVVAALVAAGPSRMVAVRGEVFIAASIASVLCLTLLVLYGAELRRRAKTRSRFIALAIVGLSIMLGYATFNGRMGVAVRVIRDGPTGIAAVWIDGIPLVVRGEPGPGDAGAQSLVAGTTTIWDSGGIMTWTRWLQEEGIRIEEESIGIVRMEILGNEIIYEKGGRLIVNDSVIPRYSLLPPDVIVVSKRPVPTAPPAPIE